MTLSKARFGASDTDKKTIWSVVRELRMQNFGTTAFIVPMGDSDFDTDTVVTSVGEEQLSFTYSKDVQTFDSAPFFEGPGGVPVITFDGVDEEIDTPDTGALSTAGAFSIVIICRLTDATSSILVSKWDENGAGEAREFQCGFDASDRPYMEIYDESQASGLIGRRDGTAITEGTWVHLGFTFSGGTDAADISVALNGVFVDDADVADDVGFADAEDTAALLAIGYLRDTSGNKAEFVDGQIAGGDFGPVMVLAELTADQLLRDFQLFQDHIGSL